MLLSIIMSTRKRVFCEGCNEYVSRSPYYRHLEESRKLNETSGSRSVKSNDEVGQLVYSIGTIPIVYIYLYHDGAKLQRCRQDLYTIYYGI